MKGINKKSRRREWLISFLKSNYDLIIEKWLSLVTNSQNDVAYDFIKEDNGHAALRLLIIYLRRQNLEFLKTVSKKLVENRLQTTISLPELIKNINYGRKIILELLAETDVEPEYKIETSLLVNDYFDAYIYDTSDNYIHLKDKIISEKNQFIQEMHHDRLTILGKLATSFAHEFRNPLTSIKGFLNLIERDYVHDEHGEGYFSIINSEIANLEEKVTQFLYLSKMKGLGDNMAPFNLSKLLKEIITFLFPRFIVDAIQVDENIEPNLMVIGVKEQLKQVFLNILNNAVEELNESPRERCINIKAIVEDNMVNVEMVNNGRMIPKHILDNIFEPFISTKELGAGLGLSVCRQIVEKHEGEIHAQSTHGKTAFKIKLPYLANEDVPTA